MNTNLPYDPGVLPTRPAPNAGETILIHVEKLPPYKDEHFSIRNLKHKIHARFKSLREAAIKVMDGRAAYRGAVQLDFVMCAPPFETGTRLLDYVDGIMDTLDGSHGPTFTYLPIVYEDDCQISTVHSHFEPSVDDWYELRITFL